MSSRLLAFFIHLAPSFMLLVATAVAWRWSGVGGAGFILLGLLFTLHFNTYRSATTFLLISAPLFLIGGLFLLDRYLLKPAN